MKLKSYEAFLNEAASVESQTNILLDSLNFLTQLQVYHWQTNGKGSFAQHKTFDDVTAAFKPLMDGLAESMQGRYKKLIIPSDYQSPLYNISDLSPGLYADGFVKKLEVYKKDFAEESDLANIIDEMIALTNKFKYLLTFE